MSEIYIPSKQSKQFLIENKSDLFGNLVHTKNMDFSKRGYATLAQKPIALYTSADDADFGIPLAILDDADVNYYIVTSGKMFSAEVEFDLTFTERAGGTPPTFSAASDAVFFAGVLVASGTTMVCSYASATWTSRITSLAALYQRRPLCVSEHQQYLAVGNNNTVILYNTSWSAVTTCTLPTNQIVMWIRWKDNLLYIGTRNIGGGNGRLYLWNGAGTAANAGYDVGANATLSACEHESSMVIVCSNGLLRKFVGGGFVPLKTDDGRTINFPCVNDSYKEPIQVSNRGMISKNGLLYIHMSTTSLTRGGSRMDRDNMPAGVWVFDSAIGLYHKAGADYKRRSAATASALDANTLTLAAAEVYETADPVICVSKGNLTGDITSELTYYAIKVDSTHIKLALTAEQAIAGQNITITGAVTNATFRFNVYASTGALRNVFSVEPGAIASIEKVDLPRFFGSEILWGATTYNGAGTATNSIQSLGMGRNVGSFTTPKIQANAVTDVYKKLIAKFPASHIPTRKYIIKYRTDKRAGIPGRGNIGSSFGAQWATSTTFTVNPKTYDMYSVRVGDEIQITVGAASGYTAHITDITVTSATVWTITIDEAMPLVVANEYFDFLVGNWTKYKTISTADDAQAAATGIKKTTFGKNAKTIELKIELRGYSDFNDTVDLEEVMLVRADDQKYA